MSTYVIGDIQGCLDELKLLLRKIKFSADKDVIWFAGDLVNRGPKSLEVLRFVKNMEENAVSVLGNHELHMLAIVHGLQKQRPSDTFSPIMEARDRDELMDWVAKRPLIHTSENNHQVLVHAGIYPLWSIVEAKQYAKEVECVLRGNENQLRNFLSQMYGNQPDRWCDSLTGWDRLRFITNAFTRMRYCTEDYRLELKSSEAPNEQKENLTPWYAQRKTTNNPHSATHIFFGHWSTLGLVYENGIYCLDTGCLWGGKLTALKIDATTSNQSLEKSLELNGKKYFQVNCKGEQNPL